MPRFSDNHELVYKLEGRIDYTNVADLEKRLFDAVAKSKAPHIVLDADHLVYISSAGLRLVVRLVKSGKQVSIINVSPSLYEILDLTGIIEYADVKKRLRSESIEGLRQIGAGAFGTVYRLDDERVLKVYDAQVSPLEKLMAEQRAARQAFIHEIPSAIPFEVVRVGHDYGIIYELIDAQTLGEAVVADADHLDDYARKMARLLRQLHQTHLPAESLSDARKILHRWVDIAQGSGLYQADTINKLRELIDSIPATDTFVHGDFHPANIMVMPDGELLLIDMSDASVGDPTIDLAGVYHVLRVASLRPGGAQQLTGMPLDLLDRLWGTFIRTYYDVSDEGDVQAIEAMLRYCALPRGMGSLARTKLISDNERKEQAVGIEQEFLANYGHVHWGVPATG